MKRVAYFALFMLATASPWGWIVSGARADGGGFSPADLDGYYGFSFDGFVITPLVPISAVGQFHAKNGDVPELTRTLNFGGIIIEDTFTSESTATVESDGTGSATFCTISRNANGAPFPEFTRETFSFVITGKDKDEIEFIGTEILPTNEYCNPQSAKPIPASVRGTARKQGEGGDDDD